MNVERYVKRLDGFEEGEEVRVVEKSSGGRAVDEDAFEAELRDAALHLANRLRDVVKAGGDKGSEAIGVGADCGRRLVMNALENCVLIFRAQLVDPDGGEREHLHVDAAFVHGAEAALTEIEELLTDAGKFGGEARAKAAGRS